MFEKFPIPERSRRVLLVALIQLFVVMTGKAQSYGFVEIGGGGYVTSVIACPKEKNLFYAKTDVGGVFRWQESQKRWKPLFGWVANNQTSYLGAEALAIDPSSPNKLYVLVGTSYWDGGKSAILRSSDYGETYQITDVTAQFKANGNGSDRQKGETLAVDPNNGNLLFCGTRYNNGLFKSTDAGISWQKVNAFNVTDASISFVEFDPASGKNGSNSLTIYVGVNREGENLYLSNDGGVSWKSAGGHATGKPQRCAITSDRFLYVTYSGTVGAVKKMNLTTNLWTDCTPPISWQANQGFSGITIDQNSPKKVVTTTYNWWQNQQQWGWADAIYYSEDGGASWKEKAGKNVASMDKNGIPWIAGAMHWVGCATFDPAKPGYLFVVSGNGVFATENVADANPVWKFLSHGLEETVLLDLISIPGGPLISSVGDQGGFVHKDITNFPESTIAQSSGFAFAGLNPNIIARIATDLYLSEDNAVSWNKLFAPPGGLAKGKVAVSANGRTILWKSTLNGQEVCFYTTDKSVNWGSSSGLNFNCIPMGDPLNSLKFYAYNSSDGYLYASKDGGKNFLKAGLAGTGGLLRFAVSHGMEGQIWIAMKSKGLAWSRDAGDTFNTTALSACDAVSVGKAAPGTSIPVVYIYGKPLSSDTYGIYRSVDNAATWERADNNQHQFGHLANGGLIEADRNIYGRVYRSTAGMGIPFMDAPVIPTTGIAKHSENSGVNFYPNPFKNNITMRMDHLFVKMVSVYDYGGRLLQVIHVKNDSNNRLQFGEELKRGSYLVKVQGEKFSETYKIVKQ